MNNLQKTTEICSYASQSCRERNPYATTPEGCLTKLNPELHDTCSPIYQHNNYLHEKYVRKLLEPQGCGHYAICSEANTGLKKNSKISSKALVESLSNQIFLHPRRATYSKAIMTARI